MYERMPVQAIGVDRVLIAGSFETAAGDPTVVNGVGFSVTRSGIGVYVVALDEPNPFQILSIMTGVGSKTEANEMRASVDPDTVTTAGFTLRLDVGGTPTDDAGSLVSFNCIVSDSLASTT